MQPKILNQGPAQRCQESSTSMLEASHAVAEVQRLGDDWLMARIIKASGQWMPVGMSLVTCCWDILELLWDGFFDQAYLWCKGEFSIDIVLVPEIMAPATSCTWNQPNARSLYIELLLDTFGYL